MSKEMKDAKAEVGEKEEKKAMQNILPESGLVRLSQILGDKKKGVWPPLVPIGKTQWWAGVKSGRYPQPIKLSERTTCWYAADIRALIQREG